MDEQKTSSGTLLNRIFGTWQPPVWMGELGARARRGVQVAWQHKRVSALTLVVAAALGTGGYAGWRAWRNRPQPQTVDVSLSAPGLTPLEDNAQPSPLTIQFTDSVAPLQMIDKAIKSGVALKPAIAGRWKWTSDRTLLFAPKGDWPVGEKVTVKLNRKGLVSEHVLLSTYELEFETPKFDVQLEGREFYQDPTDPALKKAVATFAFTHPVDPRSFEQSLKLAFEPSNKEERSFAPGFHVTYDKFKGKAFVHSESLPVPQKDADVVITLKPGTHAAAGGPAKEAELTGRVVVPGLYNFFRITSVDARVVDNPRMEPEQILFFETSGGVTEKEMARNVSAYLLPEFHPKEKVEGKAKPRPYRWSGPESISSEILAAARKLELEPLPAEREYVTLHAYRYVADAKRYVYVQVKKGTTAFGGYILGDTAQSIVRVPEFPRQLKIMHSGSLLSTSGERKVSVFTRDIPGLRFKVARILPAQIQHLVARTSGSFAQPYFSWDFDLENIAEFSVVKRMLPKTPGKPIYESLDLTPYLGPEGNRRGLFVVEVDSWSGESTMGESDRRFILLSDLGVFVKRAVDNTRTVFVQSISNGRPIAGAQVEVLGKNGVSVAKERTDATGAATLPALGKMTDERSPTVIVVSSGNDSSFLPWGQRDRELDVSRFDVGGVVESDKGESLTAYGFSDRGLYRPEETFHVGFIVRSQDWAASYASMPLLATITDPRGVEIKRQPVTLDSSGLVAIDYTTGHTSPTGMYSTSLYTVKDGKAGSFLGSTTLAVREFLPDRMAIKAELSKRNLGGWVSASDLTAKVTLTNLFGTPAGDRRVRARVQLTPGMPTIRAFPGFVFHDSLRNDKTPNEPINEWLPETRTDENGEATLELNLSRFTPATYHLSVMTEGFEDDSGRSVVAETSAFVSPLAFMIGYKADGDLSYISKGAARTLELVAASPEGTRRDAPGLEQVIFERTYVSTLVRQSNGTFRYQSIAKDIERSRKAFAISSRDARVALPTDTPGSFVLVVRSKEGTELQRIPFQVAGQANLERNMDRITELQLALANGDIQPGGTIEVQIKAPYPGSGLITIERDRVYAHKWFRAETTATIEKIEVPVGLEAGGYVSVAMIRDAASPDIFTSPLSYGVVPFAMNRDKRRIDIKVKAPALVKPGMPFTMEVTADKRARAVVFAVDEGILKVAHYKVPDPLAHFLRKRQLGVSTTQILDLVLPEHRLLLQSLAPGGGDDAESSPIGANLNPFKRRTDAPAVYWSGVVDVGPNASELTFNVPDSFNGTLKVMAVAANAGAVGAYSGQGLVRGDFVISPNAPTFVAPGDTFEVPVTIANNVEGSGANGKLRVELETTEHLEILGDRSATLSIAEMREGATAFRLRAKSVLGSAGLTFTASLGKTKGRRRVDLSVRPATPYRSTLAVGYVKDNTAKVPLNREMYAEFRTLTTALSPLPATLASGLAKYLEKYPHGCTEQITSQAVPALVLAAKDAGSLPSQDASNALARYIETLWTRQNDEGGFGNWVANPSTAKAASVYAALTLTEAKERGFAVPRRLLEKTIEYLKQVANATPDDLADARVRAMAIYVLTRNAMVTTTFAAAAQKNLEANHPKVWRGDLAGAYLAATYALLQNAKLSGDLARSIEFGKKRETNYYYYYDSMAHDAQVLYLLAKHFPERAAKLAPESLELLIRSIQNDSYNTFSSALTILALDSYERAATPATSGTRNIAQLVNGKTELLTPPQGRGALVDFSAKANALQFDVRGDFGAYYVVSMQGFDRGVPTKAQGQKLEVFREYLGADGKPVTKVAVGDEIRVQLRVRSVGVDYVPNAAIVDLLPGGFEVVVQSLPEAENDSDESSDDESDYESSDGEASSDGGDSDDGDSDAEEPDEGDYGDEYSDDGESGSGSFGLPIALDGSTLELEYGDVREDRVVLYGGIGKGESRFVYAIKATNAGEYTVPPIKAESLYDRSAYAHGVASKIVVEKPAKK